MDVNQASSLAKNLIDGEVANQNAMWGELNDRADHTKGQLLQAGLAQSVAIWGLNHYDREKAFQNATNWYPHDWSGFRDYGSDVANLVVAAAFLQQEIKRRLLNGESYERSKRTADQPYNAATGLPNTQV